MSLIKRCPACSGSLLAAPTREALLGCGACGGVWADNTTSKEIVEKLDQQLVALAETAAELAARRVGAPLPSDARARRCPDCEGALDRVVHASTHLDVCTTHGTWFDRGELPRVVRILAHERDLKDPKWRSSKEYRVVEGVTSLNAAAPYNGPSGSDTASQVGGEVAAGVFVLAIELLIGAATS